MKKIILASLLLIAVPMAMTTTSSCNVLKTTSNAANTFQTIGKIANVAATAKQVSGVLGNTLNLNGNQQSSLLGIITKYIGGTNGIAGLAGSNMSAYIQKLTSLNTGTLGSIGKIMNAAQYAKLLGLGGKSNSKQSLLGNLVGGKGLSNDATSVLSGLLLNAI